MQSAVIYRFSDLREMYSGANVWAIINKNNNNITNSRYIVLVERGLKIST